MNESKVDENPKASQLSEADAIEFMEIWGKWCNYPVGANNIDLCNIRLQPLINKMNELTLRCFKCGAINSEAYLKLLEGVTDTTTKLMRGSLVLGMEFPEFIEMKEGFRESKPYKLLRVASYPTDELCVNLIMLLSTIKVISNEETEKEFWKTDELRQNAVLYFFYTGAQISAKTKGVMNSINPKIEGTNPDRPTDEKKAQIQIIEEPLKPDEVRNQTIRQENKKCPYCAELIKKDANFCRYCGKQLPHESSKKSKVLPFLPFNGKPEPSIWKSLLFMILLLALIYGVAILVAGVFRDQTDIEISFLLLQGGMRIAIAIMAGKAIRPKSYNFWIFLGLIFLSFIPILSWIVIFYAGKYLAWKA